jgi:hypothetical protein
VGPEPGAGNVISGQDCPSSSANCFGVSVFAPSQGPVTGTLVQGNYIGTDAEGDDPLPNKSGVVVSFPEATGTLVTGNVISGNTIAGVLLQLGSGDTLVQGNLIGPAAGGTPVLGNGFGGVGIDGGDNRIVSNTIRGASQAGVAVFAGLGNWISRNSIDDNGLGIDLTLDGVTPNDAGDADDGPNRLQNFPLLSAAAPGTRVAGTLSGAPSRELLLEFFASPAADPTSHGEGARFLGARSVTTDAAGAAAFAFGLSAAVADGEWISATATDEERNTSELGPGVAAVEPDFRGTGLAVDAAGNGVWEPGETVSVAPVWRNASASPETLSGQAGAPTGPPGLSLSVTDGTAVYGTVPADASASCTATGDCFAVSASLSGPRPQAHIDAVLPETLGSGATRSWALHVGGSFADVASSSPFFRFVETLLHTGVTGGCAASAYCGGAPTARQEMAVFALAAAEGAGYRPLPCVAGRTLFMDVPSGGAGFCRWIEELARRGVVSGCGPGRFCPAAPVSRAEVAVFVLGTVGGAPPPPCTPGAERFNDVPAASPFCPWIEELARRGVVTGCGGGAYCPGVPVTRAQMAVFLALPFGLQLYGP